MYSVLMHFINPLFLDNEAYFCIIYDDYFEIFRDIDRLYNFDNIVTHDVNLLNSFLRHRDKTPLLNSIDISNAYQLITGKPAKYFDALKPWSFWSLISKNDEFSSLAGVIYQSINNFIINELNFEDLNFREQLRLLCLEFRRIWYNALLLLKDRGEYQRFFEIELKISNIFQQRHYYGLAVDVGALNRRLNALDDLMSNSSNYLRGKWKVLDPSSNDEVKKILLKGDSWSNIVSHSFNVDSLIGLDIEFDDFISNVNTYRKAKRDKQILLRMGCINCERVYPDFYTIGTVTARIMVKNPPLQMISKNSRCVLRPDDEYSFLYPDYSAFEPGILAHESNDIEFMSAYNNGDIYTDFSEAIFASKGSREVAKKLFLSFMYGMTTDRLLLLISKYSNVNIEDAGIMFSRFTNRFQGLLQYSECVKNQLATNGKVSSVMGNYRYLDSSSNYHNWALSQRIQGTASLILKKSILALNNIKEIQILLPMHDALLIQVPKENISYFKNIASEIFIENFKKVCPQIMPRVKFDKWTLD